MHNYLPKQIGIGIFGVVIGVTVGIPFAIGVGVYGLSTLIKEKIDYNPAVKFLPTQLAQYFSYVPSFEALPRISNSLLEKIICGK